MGDRSLDQRDDLLAVAAERTSDERAAQRQGDSARVDRLESVDRAFFLHGAEVGGGRKLTFGQPVRSVVFDDVGAVDVAPDHVQELAEADRSGVPVAGDAEHDQLAVGELSSGRQRRHAAVHAVEPVRGLDKIGRRLRRAADA